VAYGVIGLLEMKRSYNLLYCKKMNEVDYGSN